MHICPNFNILQIGVTEMPKSTNTKGYFFTGNNSLWAKDGDNQFAPCK